MTTFWEKLKKNFIYVKFCSQGKKDGEKKKLKDFQWVILLLAGAVLMLFSSFFISSESERAEVHLEAEETVSAFASKEVTQEEKVEQELEKILNKIEGVSDVSVLVSFYAGPKYIYAVNYEENFRETEERDRDGGSRDIVEKNNKDQIVLRRGEKGEEIPLIIEEIYPEVQGVLVVARGVEQPVKKSQIVEAVKTILDLPYHKVVVLPRGK